MKIIIGENTESKLSGLLQTKIKAIVRASFLLAKSVIGVGVTPRQK